MYPTSVGACCFACLRAPVLCAMQVRVQRIIAERFLPMLDDAFVAHKAHILRTTAYAGGPACIAGVLATKSKDLGASGGHWLP